LKCVPKIARKAKTGKRIVMHHSLHDSTSVYNNWSMLRERRQEMRSLIAISSMAGLATHDRVIVEARVEQTTASDEGKQDINNILLR
jgi:hypothetical protein